MEFTFGEYTIKSINEFKTLSKYFPYGITSKNKYYIYITDRFIRDFNNTINSIELTKIREVIISNFIDTLNNLTSGDINIEGTSCWHEDNSREGKLGHYYRNTYVIRIAYKFEDGVFIINNVYNHNLGNKAEKSSRDNSNQTIGAIIRDKNFSWDKLKYKIVLDKTIELNKLLQLYELNDEEREVCLSYKYKDLDKIKSAIKKYLSEKENKINEIKNIFGDEDISTEELNIIIKDELIKYLENKILSEKYYFKLQEGYLTEANRQQLLQKSRNAKHYKDISKGKNRYERRMKSKISATVRDYNNIQMDQFFKRDILEIKIPVMGETDVYQVDIKINGVLKEIQNQIHTNKGELEFKVILQSLMKVLNIGDVYIGCDCPDARYRMAYNQTKNGYKAGYRETRPSNITNPRDDLGSGCKHTMLVLANLDWCVKVASVINNYIKYCQEHLKQAYADYIFPKVYGTKYDRAIQMNLFYNGMLPEDRKLMDEITSKSLQGRDAQGKFKKENPYTFQKKDLNEPNENQLQLNLNEPKEKELKVEN